MQNKFLMKDFIIEFLDQNLPETYYYHNHFHTIYVAEIAAEIGKHEKCSAYELDLLNVAALWHDTGYIKTYKNHEEESCKFTRQCLPEYGYSIAEIDQICGMIMATKIPQSPNNKLEKILADADLEYLGTESAQTKSASLMLEIQSINPSLTEEKWNQMQISFIQNHQYFTRFCKENRESVKQNYLNKLIQSTL